MTRRFISISSLALLLAGTCLAPSRSASPDSDFVTSAQADMLGEYAIAAVARSKAADPALKALADKMAANADHVNSVLKSYAAAHKISLPNKAPARADVQYGDMQSLSGKAFDQKFAQAASVDTQLDASDFQDEAKSGTDPQLKALAKEQTGLLQALGDEAQKLGR